MDQIWLASPSPAMRLWPGRPRSTWRLNPAAQAWGRAIALTETSWNSVAAELCAAHAEGAERKGRLSRPPALWRSLPMSTGWLVWLIPGDGVPDDAGDWTSVAERLELLQDVGRIGIFERNLKTGVGRWDANMFRLLGFDPAEGTPSQQAVRDRIHPDDVATLEAERLRRMATAGRHFLRCRVMLPGGELRDVRTFNEVRHDADGTPALMLGAVADDTESAVQVRTHKAVSEQLANALRLARIAVWRVDLEQSWIDLNDVGYQMIGLAPVAGGVPLDSIRALAHPDDVQALARAAEEALASHAVVDLEVRYVGLDPSGHRRLLTRRVAERDADGRAIGLLGVSLEQTERIVERERAQALAQRIEMVADTAGVGVYSVDLASGEIEWNRQMFHIHGFAEDGRAPDFGQLVAQRIHPHDKVRVERTRQKLRAGVEAGFQGEVRILHPDGSVRWVEYRSRRDRLGDKWYVLGIAIDVTERVLQREVTEKSLREKEAAERANADKSAFLARMSHELRTPLNAVLGFAQLIEQGGAEVPLEVQRERIAHIRQAGEKLLTLIGDVLDRVDQEGLTDPGRLGADNSLPTKSRGAPDTGPSSKAASALTVLYIEDNPVNVILVEELVAMRAGTTLHCAADGLSGVALATARQPDVVLVDMQLPDIDGFEVLRRLRDVRGLDRSAIIALSANGISEDIALARAAGFDDYWTKPIDFRRFLSGLDQLAASR